MAVVQDLSAEDYGVAVPVYVSHSASGAPIVGTSIQYFEKRGVSISEGRPFAVLGEVMLVLV